MDIECILHKNLKSFLESERYLQSEILPISRHRGFSHFKNPKAKPEDVVLINIYETGKLVAYLGLLSDDLHFSNQKFHVGWLSCMWVSPNSRGKGFAKKLLKTAMEKWNDNLIVTDFTPPAEALYFRTGYFEKLLIREGIKNHRRLNLATFLPSKNKKWNYINLLLKITDAIFNVFYNFKNSIFSSKLKFKTAIQEVEKIDGEVISFIQKFQKNALLKRGTKDFEWQVNFPWVKNTAEAKEDQKRYFFTSYSYHFEYIYLKFLDEIKTVGFVVLAIKNDGLKVPFVYFDESNLELGNEIANHILNFMKKKKLSTITISNKILTDIFLQKKHTFFLVRNIPKQVLISKKLKQEIQDQSFTYQDGDGDAAFT